MSRVAEIGEALIADFDPDTGAEAGAADRAYDDSAWLAVALPTGVQSALARAGRIPHPFRDANERSTAWVAQREWWFRCVLPAVAPAAKNERIRLSLLGVESPVTVWLNGQRLGRHRSMFRPCELDVTELLRGDGDNLLALQFAPLSDPTTDVGDVVVRDRLRIGHRKMQVAFGWDISCCLLTIGLWDAATLTRGHCCAIDRPRFETLAVDPVSGTAALRIGADVRGRDEFDGTLELDYRLTAPDGRVLAESRIRGRDGRPHFSDLVAVDRPELWWTHDLGSPVLHTLDLTLLADGEDVDSWQQRVGIRVVELDQSPDLEEPGSRFFRFVLNGVPIFARGANWVPENLALADVDARTYADRLGQAVAAGMNMLRVWGGGTYEKDAFYEECDARGIMVWQDFMFAGLAYPNDDQELLREARAEAVHQVRRLRSHPSLALWCGNNEAVMAGAGNPGAALFGEVLPSVVRTENGSTAFWPGSPYGGDGPSSPEDGDTHDWRGFHGTHPDTFAEQGWQDPTGPGRHWRQYADGVGRFVSEFGFASSATMPTIETWNSPDQRHPRTHAWQGRIRYVPGDSHVPLMQTILGGVPDDPRRWVDGLQLIQAEGFRFGIERFRERKPHCSGALIWQLNDCWPGFTWSVVDFAGRPKPAYYTVRRAFAPVLASVRPQRGGAFQLWVVNDSPEPLDDVLRVEIRRFDGTVLHQEDLVARVPAHSRAVMLRQFGWGRVSQPRSCYVHVGSRSGAINEARQFFADLGELELPEAGIRVTRRAVDAHTVDVRLAASGLVVMAAVEALEDSLDFSDNYVTLDAGSTCTIRASHPSRTVDPTEFAVRSLYGPVTVHDGDTE